MEKPNLSEPPTRRWTRVEDYFAALAKRRTTRRLHRERVRTQPQEPRLMLSVLPFAALLAALAVLGIAIIIAAWPGQDRPEPRAVAYGPGTAPPSWFEDAKREMR